MCFEHLPVQLLRGPKRLVWADHSHQLDDPAAGRRRPEGLAADEETDELSFRGDCGLVLTLALSLGLGMGLGLLLVRSGEAFCEVVVYAVEVDTGRQRLLLSSLVLQLA